MSPTTPKDITNSHDQFFRTAMQDPRVAKEFLQTYLPEQIANLIDLNQLELQKRSRANAIRKEAVVDVLFKTKLNNQDAYVYLLLEHQSSPDPLMALRVIEYTVQIIREHLKQHKTHKIPFIYPLVVYHGRPYKFITNINELVDAPKELVDQYFLKPFNLLDLNNIEDEKLKQQLWSGAMSLALKYIFANDILPFVEDFGLVLKKLDQSDGHDFIYIMLQYIIGRGECSDTNKLFDIINASISDNTGENIMTIAEKLKLEGKLEGEMKGKLEIAKKLITKGQSPEAVAELTGLSIEELQKLSEWVTHSSHHI